MIQSYSLSSVAVVVRVVSALTLGVGVMEVVEAQGRFLRGPGAEFVVPFRTHWRLAERPVSGGPAATLAGPYVRVVVGTGRRR